MVSEPRHETTQGRPAKAIRIPGVLCDAPGVKTKILSTKNKRPGCKQRSRSHGESAEVFLLDILSHRMSVMAKLRQRFGYPSIFNCAVNSVRWSAMRAKVRDP